MPTRVPSTCDLHMIYLLKLIFSVFRTLLIEHSSVSSRYYLPFSLQIANATLTSDFTPIDEAKKNHLLLRVNSLRCPSAMLEYTFM